MDPIDPRDPRRAGADPDAAIVGTAHPFGTAAGPPLGASPGEANLTMRSPGLDGYVEFSPCTSRSETGWTADLDLVGYHVEAIDGSIGRMDEASNTVDDTYAEPSYLDKMGRYRGDSHPGGDLR